MHQLVDAMFGEAPWTEETEITRQRMLDLLQRPLFDRGTYYIPFTDTYTQIPRT